MQPFEHPLPILRGVVVARGRRIPVVDVRERLGNQTGAQPSEFDRSWW